jgi:RNA recognition motif-containing protein
MSEHILNKRLSNASGVVLIRGGEIIDFFEKSAMIEDKETENSLGFGFVEMSSKEIGKTIVEHYKLFENDAMFTDIADQEDAEFPKILRDFIKNTQLSYRKIEASQKEIEKLNTKSAKRQKRFEDAMQKLEGLLK